MPIKESSFRIGCGRYLQEAGIINTLGDEVMRLGTAPMVLGGKTALSVAGDSVENSVKKCDFYAIFEHTGTCNKTDAEKYAGIAKADGYDVIVGVGGGVMMDFAKLVADMAGLPVINVPTSSATCACYTPLSVCYTEEGLTVGTSHFKNEVNAVLADPEILVKQPIRLLLAGVFDALAKFSEISQRYSDDCPLGLDYAYIMSKQSYKVLFDNTARCIEDMKRGEITKTVEQVIFTSLAVTGVISGIARGSNQCALAHKFYETGRRDAHDRVAPFLHGELVGVGILLQNHFNGNTADNTALLSLMKDNNMPCSVADVNLGEGDFDTFYNAICNSSAIDKNNVEECEKFKVSLRWLWNGR